MVCRRWREEGEMIWNYAAVTTPLTAARSAFMLQFVPLFTKAGLSGLAAFCGGILAFW
jgi:hypothetical protein